MAEASTANNFHFVQNLIILDLKSDVNISEHNNNMGCRYQPQFHIAASLVNMICFNGHLKCPETKAKKLLKFFIIKIFQISSRPS